MTIFSNNHDKTVQALEIKNVPSAERLRQRFVENASAMIPIIDEINIDFMVKAGVPVTALKTGHVAVDIDVFPMDNSGTKKEGVSRTYKGHDGFAPIAAYLGSESWCLGNELREGSQHSQKDFLSFAKLVIPRARQLTDEPLLVRLDSAHDALENRAWFTEEDSQFLIKWNPRKENPEYWLKRANEEGVWSEPREGKRVGIFSIKVEQNHKGKSYTFRRVMRIIERTIDRNGQHLLIPEIKMEGWWTSLELPDIEVIKLYNDHGTSEQFHSEFKTDLDIERLPSGKFETNDLVLSFAVFAYNILRWIGLIGLTGDVAPIRHKAKRRRLKTVMQELMYLACRLIESGRRLKLRFSRHCPGFLSFRHVYHKLAYG